MLVKTIGKKYASALFDVAEGLKKTGEIKKTLTAFISCMNEEAYAAFKNPKRSLEAKQEDLRERFNSKLPPELINFFCLLIEKKRFEFLPEIGREFNILYDENNGFRQARIISAFAVTKEQQEKVRNTLEKRYKSKFLVEYCTDASLIGGMIINIGNEMIDGSLKNQLAKIRTKLLS